MEQKQFSRGGYIPGPAMSVTTRLTEGRTEYWEPLIGKWVPVITAAEIRQITAPTL